MYHVAGSMMMMVMMIDHHLLLPPLLLLLGAYISVLQRCLLPPSSWQQSKHVSSILKMEVRPELHESYAKRL